MRRGGRVKKSGASDLVARLMTQVTSCRDSMCAHWLHLTRAAAGKAGVGTPGGNANSLPWLLQDAHSSCPVPWVPPAQLSGLS